MRHLHHHRHRDATRHTCIRIDADVVNTELYPRRHEMDGAAGQSVDATRIALVVLRRDFRFDVLPGALSRLARIGRLLVAVATERHRVADADCELLVAKESPELHRVVHFSARRMKVDGRPAVAQFPQQLAEPIGGADIDLALGRYPFTAARSAGIGVAMGQIKFDCGGLRGIRCRGVGSRRVRGLLRNGGTADCAGAKHKDEGDRSGGHSRIGLRGTPPLPQPCSEFTFESHRISLLYDAYRGELKTSPARGRRDPPYAPPLPPPDTLAQVSRKPTVRLNTSSSGVESLSGQK